MHGNEYAILIAYSNLTINEMHVTIGEFSNLGRVVDFLNLLSVGELLNLILFDLK